MGDIVEIDCKNVKIISCSDSKVEPIISNYMGEFYKLTIDINDITEIDNYAKHEHKIINEFYLYGLDKNFIKDAIDKHMLDFKIKYYETSGRIYGISNI